MHNNTVIDFFIPGNPVPQGRPRACIRGGRVNVYDPNTSREWKRQVKIMAERHYRGAPLTGAVDVILTFRLKRPKSVKGDWHTKKPDVDNLAKAVLDAIEGVIFKGDQQVISLTVQKGYAPLTGVNVKVGKI